jgi:hypothetical protein
MTNSSPDNQGKHSELAQELVRHQAPDSNRMLGGLLVRKQCWRFSPGAKLAGLVAACVTAFGVLRFIHPFLAITCPVPADVLIVEGWSPANTMRQAAAEFRLGGCHHLLLLRPILDDTDKYQSGRYNGDYMANLLVQYGVPQEEETTLYPMVAQKDRTYHSALAARQWLAGRGMNVKSLDVATLGPHARRSRLIYEKAFGDDVKIGIIALSNREYDPAHWWRTSEGVRETLGETIAYIYARVLFHPPSPVKSG